MHPMFKNNKPKRPPRKSAAVKVTDGVVEVLDSDEEEENSVDESPSPGDPTEDTDS